MSDQKKREAARQFYYRWKDRGQEDEEGRSYWIELLQNILGMDNATERVFFEKKVQGKDGNVKRIDAYIPETRVLIEQKSLGIPLDKPQAGHNGQTPFEQARYYNECLRFEEKSRWIITSNFAEIWIYDMNTESPEPVKLLLSDLQSKAHILDFLVNQDTKEVTDETKVSLQAGELVGKLYEAFLKQYKDPDDPEVLKSLNKLCVRIVFCLYAEDADVFPKNRFHDYMIQTDARGARKALMDLFAVLNQRPEDRDPYLEDDDPLLASFPYVNGGLFAEDDIVIPPLTDELMDLILYRASDEFDWSEISPTIFGAVFESTLNPDTRRSGGMHYTSLENIHKVIDPLLLDDLKQELAEIHGIAVEKTRIKKLRAFQEKLASLTFLDPAAGSGNFLTETYLCLRRLENEVIDMLQAGQVVMGVGKANPIKVAIDQFYGIEINDFAVTVAKAALWIAESQMMKETEDIVHMNLDFLPLTSNATIVEGNALRMDWEDVVPKDKLNYIMGNPPFVGARLMNSEQKKDVNEIFFGWKNAGNLDYVACWYKKAADMMTDTEIRSALVSTNSVTQGESAGNLWKPLIEEGVHIDYAYKTFRWDSEATMKAHVHCVIIGFSKAPTVKARIIFDENGATEAENISGYLIDAPDIYAESRTKPICHVPEIGIGNKPIDDGNYLFEKEDMQEFIKIEPESERYFRPWYGSREFINRSPRYCLYLGDCSPVELRSMPNCMKRVQAVRDYRLSSKSVGTRKIADTPTRFHVTNMPKGNYIVIPEVSSERRRYVPMGFMTPEMMCSNLVRLIPDADLYLFGVLTSNVHMAWMRTVAGRLKSDYRYSKDIVYNNFPWPETTETQRERIKESAQGILDARELYPDSSLADLYDSLTMPRELLKAHQANDRAVMQAYGMSIKDIDEAACAVWLLRLYQEKVEELENG